MVPQWVDLLVYQMALTRVDLKVSTLERWSVHRKDLPYTVAAAVCLPRRSKGILDKSSYSGKTPVTFNSRDTAWKGWEEKRGWSRGLLATQVKCHEDERRIWSRGGKQLHYYYISTCTSFRSLFLSFFFYSNGPVVHPIQLGHHDLVLATTYLPTLLK